MATTNLRFRIIGDDDASGAFLKVAAASKLLNSTFSDLGQNTLGLTKLIGGAGLLPVLAGTTAAITELGTSMAAGGLALGVFGASAVGIASDMVKAQQAIKVTDTALSKLTPGTAEYAAKLKELHAQQQAFTQDFGKAGPAFDRMKASFEGFKQATSGATTDTMAKGFSLISSVLPKLVPVSNAAARAVGGLLDDLRAWTKSSSFTAVIKWLKTSGPAAITHFGHAIGNTVDGLGGIFANFVGPGDHAAKTLEKLTKRFADWGHSKGVSDSVDKFLKYVSGNGGKISSVMSDLAGILPKLATAVAGLGSANLTGISMFLNLLAGMPQGVFDVVVKGMFGIAVASKAIAITSGLTAIFTGLTAAMTVLGDACLLTRAQLVLLWATEKIGAAVTATMAAAQWLLNAAMTANPIALVVVAIAALVAALIIAYKHSETFRNIVNGAFHGVQVAASAVFGWIKDHWALLFAILGGPIGLVTVVIIKNFDKIRGAIQVLGKWATWLWNNAFQPALHFIVTGISILVDIWGHMLSALGHVPGFGWAGDAGDALQAAADRARALADGINKIPSNKTVTIHYNVDAAPGAFTHSGGGSGGGAGGGSGGGAGGRGMLVKPGIALIEGLVDGIKQGFVRLPAALSKVTDYVKSQRDKLQTLMSSRTQFASGFQSFTTSLFGADFGQDAAGNTVTPDVAGIIAYQQRQAQQAAQVKQDVRALIRKGLSKSLIKQLQAGGQAGMAQISALASASPAEIARLNSLNAATTSRLGAAGMSAGNAIYGKQIVQTRNNIDLAKRLAHELKQMDDHGKGEYVVIKIDGNEIVKAIRKDKRTRGAGSAV